MDRLATLLDGRPMQLGGDETIGKGVLWCRVHFVASSGATFQDCARAGTPSLEPAPAVAPVAPPATQQRPSPAAMPRRNRG